MQNSLALGDGLDSVEILREVERTFGIAITNDEAQATQNVGDLYALIEAKCDTAEKTEACLSQIAFYKIRHTLASAGIERVAPSTPISIVRRQGAGSLAQLWSDTAQRSGLTFPPLETPFVFNWGHTKGGRIVGLIALICVLGAGFAIARYFGFSLGWAWFGSIGLLVAGIFILDYVLFLSVRDIPRRIETVGDLAREASGYTYGALRKPWRKESRMDRWSALTAILRQQSGHKPKIDKQTTFYLR